LFATVVGLFVTNKLTLLYKKRHFFGNRS
jgi:hypothetical protein